MNKLITNVGMLLICVCLVKASGMAQTAVSPPHEDIQEWSELFLIKPVSKNRDLILFGQLRFGSNITRPVDERIGAGVAFHFGKHFTLLPSYQYIAQQPYTGRKAYSHRLTIEGTYRFNLGRFVVADRQRLERFVRHSRNDIWNYRNRLTIEHPVTLHGFAFSPFAGDEVFYDTGFHVWSRNRFSVGIKKEFLEKKLRAEWFYLHQNDGHARPGNLHVIGANFRIYL